MQTGIPVRPWDVDKLLPPSLYHDCDVEAEDEGDWYEAGVAVAVHGHLLELSEKN